MTRSTPNRYPVVLTEEQRERLTEVTRNGRSPARKIRRAQVLLWSDRGRPEGHLSRTEIAERLGMHLITIDRIRKQFCTAGEAPALDRRARAEPPTPPTLDGRGEAQLVAICTGPPPEGRARWTLSLLADELVRRGVVTQICAETVRRALKKTS
jgi:transposase